jgi:hypothetical protein
MSEKNEQRPFIEEKEEKPRLNDAAGQGDWRPRINYQWIVNNVPFLLFLSFLALIYIANGHFAVKNIREINDLEKEVKELHWHYLDEKTELMFRSKMSEVSQSVAPYGLQVPQTPPLEIKGQAPSP